MLAAAVSGSRSVRVDKGWVCKWNSRLQSSFVEAAALWEATQTEILPQSFDSPAYSLNRMGKICKQKKYIRG